MQRMNWKSPLQKQPLKKNLQADPSEINIRCKELSLTTLRLQNVSSPGNRIKLISLRAFI